MTDEKRYRTEVPNIIDDLGLDPHERALYVHYKRACGGNDCEWIESIRMTAQRTKMSVGRASEARKSLVNRGLIRLIPKGNDGTAVKIVNIWDLNTIFYQQEHRPDIDGWTIEQLKEWYQGVHNMNTLEQEEGLSSEPEGEGVHIMKAGVHIMKAGVHIMNNKKEPIKKEPKESYSGKKPQEDSEKWNNINKKIVGDKFLELTELKPPVNKKTAGAWWGWLFEIFEMSDRDAIKTCQVMEKVVKYMRGRRSDITSPKSLLNYSRVVASGQELGGEGVKNNGSAASRASPRPQLTEEEEIAAFLAHKRQQEKEQ